MMKHFFPLVIVTVFTTSCHQPDTETKKAGLHVDHVYLFQSPHYSLTHFCVIPVENSSADTVLIFCRPFERYALFNEQLVKDTLIRVYSTSQKPGDDAFLINSHTWPDVSKMKKYERAKSHYLKAAPDTLELKPGEKRYMKLILHFGKLPSQFNIEEDKAHLLLDVPIYIQIKHSGIKKRLLFSEIPYYLDTRLTSASPALLNEP